MLVAHADAGSGTVTIGDYYATAHAKPLEDAQSDWTLLSSEAAVGFVTVTARRKLDTGDTRHDLTVPKGIPVYIVWAFDDRAKFFAHRANHKGWEQLVLYGKEDEVLMPQLPADAVKGARFVARWRRSTVRCACLQLRITRLRVVAAALTAGAPRQAANCNR